MNLPGGSVNRVRSGVGPWWWLLPLPVWVVLDIGMHSFSRFDTQTLDRRVTLDHLRGEIDEYAKAKASKITNEDIPAVMQTSFLVKAMSRLKYGYGSIPSHLVYH